MPPREDQPLPPRNDVAATDEITNLMLSAGLPGRGVFLRLNRKLSELRSYRVLLGLHPGRR